MKAFPRRVLAVAIAVASLVLPASAGWAATANQPPAAPTSLTVAGIACAPGGIFVGTTSPQVTGYFTDPDMSGVQSESLTPQFVVWPADDPAQRADWTTPEMFYAGVVFTHVPSTLVNGGRYHLKARATDKAGAVSAWSPVCTFTVDTTVPHQPSVTSTDYPSGTRSGGPGVPGKFTFAVTGGDKDVVKFRYSSDTVGLTDVPVGPKGRATVEITPASYGLNVVTVQAIDRTGNRSGETTYEFHVTRHEPSVIDQNSGAGVGEPREVWLWSEVPDTASYAYQFNDDPAVTVAATPDANGYTHITVTPDRRGDNFLTVTSQTASGVLSPSVKVNLYVPVTLPRPVITSPDFPTDGTPPPTVGQEVTIFLTTDSPEVAEFVYSLDLGETQQVVTADENGNATLHITTGPWPYLEVDARARTADGFESDLAVMGWELTPAP